MLSNFGTLAGRYGIPLVVPPAVAILGAGKVRDGRRRRRRPVRGASPHAAVPEFRSPLHHRRRGVPLSRRRYRRSRTAGLNARTRPCTRPAPNNIANRGRRGRRRGASAEIHAQLRLTSASCRRTTPTSTPRTWRRAIRRSSPARRCRTLMFARRRRGRALVRVFNPTVARARLHLAAHRHRDGERRHAVPGRLDRPRADAARRSPCIFWRIPIFAVARDGAGISAQHSRSAPRAAETGSQRLESFQHVEVDRIVDPAALQSLRADIERSMRDVRVACADWAKMRAAARQTVRGSEFLERALRCRAM